MSTQTGSISFEATGGFNSYAKQNYATLSQIKGQFATCSTGASTAAKVATIVPADSGWTLYTGATVTVKFTSKNTAVTPTLNVNNTGAKTIRDYNGNELTKAAREWLDGAAIALTYDGTYWRIQDSDLMERVYSAKTAIEQNATNIALKANSSDVYNKASVDGFISKEVTDRNAAIKTASDSITSTVAANYTTKTEFNNLEIGGKNLWPKSFDLSLVGITSGNQQYFEFAEGLNGSSSIRYKGTNTGSSRVFCGIGSAYVTNVTIPDTLNKDTTFVISAYVKVNGDISGSSIFVRFTLTNNRTFPNGLKYKDINLPVLRATSSEWTRIDLATEIPAENYSTINITIGGQGSGTFEFCLPKLEQGTIATDWTPAPEDIEERVSSAESAIIQNADNIALKVSTTDYNGNTVASLINQSADSVKIQAKHIEIDGTATFKNSDNTTTTLGNYLTNNYDTKGAAAAVQTNLDNLQIGGRNLLQRSSISQENLETIGASRVSVVIDSVGGYSAYKATGANTSIRLWYDNTHLAPMLEANTVYTYSAWVYLTTTTNTTSVPLNFTSLGHFGVSNNASTASDKTHEDVASERIYTPTNVPIGKWTHISFTFITNSLEGSVFGVYPKYNLGTDYTLYIRNMKLEKGNKATDWSPAPEDAEAATLAAGVEYIAGTQTAATNNWTGITKETSLVAGKTIAYKLPYAGNSSGASLQLKDSAGNNVGGNIPVYSMTTRVTSHYPAGSIIQMTFDGSNWRTAGWYNTNNYDRTLHNNYVKAAAAVTSGAIVCGTSAGYKQVAASVAFDLSYPILWAGGAWTSGSQYANAYENYPSVNIATTLAVANIPEIAANKIVYVVGKVNGNTFTCASANYLTCKIPNSEDGNFYIPIGILANDYTSTTTNKLYFNSSKSLYAYIDGKFRQVTPTEIVATHRIYYRTTAANNSLAAPTTWVNEATANVYNAWTTKIPPLANGTNSSANGYTKYPCLYTCEQRKRLDGTVECTKVLLDENTTVIDGGNIITNSIAANKIKVSEINIGDLAGEIGGKNLLAYSGTGRGWSYSTFADGVYTRSTTTTSESYISGKTTVPLELGATYTFSAWMKTNGQVSSVEMVLYDAAVKTVKSKNFSALTIDWEYYTWTVTMPDTWVSGTNETAIWIARFDNNGSKTSGTEAILYVRQPKLEKGNKPTDWSPAPEDVDSAIDDASKIASNYITHIDNAGITIHPSSTTNNRVAINSNGMTIYKDNSDVANFGVTARVGKNNSSRFLMNSDSLQAYNSSNTKYFEVSANGLSWGNNIAATTTQLTNIQNEIPKTGGLCMKVNCTSWNGTVGSNNGECLFCGLDDNYAPANSDGWVIWNGSKVTIPKGYWINPDTYFPYNVLTYCVRRTSNNVFYGVYWDTSTAKWKARSYNSSQTAGNANATDWTWNDNTDIILASYMQASSEAAITGATLFDPPKHFSEIDHSENIKEMYDHIVDLSSSTYSQDTWYPIILSPAKSGGSTKVVMTFNGAGGTPTWSNHNSKHWACSIDITYYPSQWGWKPSSSSFIDSYNFGQLPDGLYPVTFSEELNHSDKLVMYCRGGGIYSYKANTPIPPSIKTETYTFDSAQSVSPTTTQPVNSSTFVVSRRETQTNVTNAATTATNYMSFDSTDGLRIASANPSTQNQRIQLTSGRIDFYNSSNTSIGAINGDVARFGKLNHTYVNINGNDGDIDIYKNNYLKAKYSSNIILYGGSNASGANPKVELTSEVLRMYDASGNQRFEAGATNGVIIGNPSGGRVTARNDTGVTIYDSSNKKRTAVDASGLHVFDASSTPVEVALFGSTVGTSGTTAFARIGQDKSSRFEISPTTLRAYTGTTKYFEVSASGMTWGSNNTAATTSQVEAAQDTANTALSGAIEYIVGTHGSTATNAWTGVTRDSALYTGKQIAFYMTSAGTGSAATLNLTLADGKTTGAKNVRLNNSNVTTHYAQYSVLKLTYDGTYWKCDNYTTGDTVANRYASSVVAGLNGIRRYTLCMKDSAGNWTSIVNQANNVAASGKTCYTGGLQLGKVMYHAAGADYAADANSGEIWESRNTLDFRYSANGIALDSASTLQLRKFVYLVGTVKTDGLFYLDATNWWTQTPNDTAKTYVFIGAAHSAKHTNGGVYQINLSDSNPTFKYDGSKLVEQIITNYMHFDSTNGLVIARSTPSISVYPHVQITSSSINIKQNATSYTSITSSGLDVYTTVSSKANKAAHFGTDILLYNSSGKYMLWANGNGISLYDQSQTERIAINSGGITIKGGTTNQERLVISSGAATFFDGGNKARLKLNGTDGVVMGNTTDANQGRMQIKDDKILFYDNSGESSLGAKIDANGLTMYQKNSKRAATTANGLDIFGPDGSTSVASFGTIARIGESDSANAEIDNDSIKLFGANNSVAFEIGTSSGAETTRKIETSFSIFNFQANSQKTYNHSPSADTFYFKVVVSVHESDLSTFEETFQKGTSLTVTKYISLITTNTDVYTFTITYNGTNSFTIKNTSSVAFRKMYISISHDEDLPSPSFTFGTRASGFKIGGYSIGAGINVTASEKCSHAEGFYTTANGSYSHAEGYYTIANGKGSHAEGNNTGAIADYTHAEGYNTKAQSDYSHAEGYNTKAQSDYSHAEGWSTIANGYCGHAEGFCTRAAYYSHAEGYNTIASGYGSHAQNGSTVAEGEYQTVLGRFNAIDTTSAVIIGNSSSDVLRSNALTIDWNGHTTQRSLAAAVTSEAPNSNIVLAGMYHYEKSDARIGYSEIVRHPTTVYRSFAVQNPVSGKTAALYLNASDSGNTSITTSSGTALAITGGGTGATTAAAARTNLGVDFSFKSNWPTASVKDGTARANGNTFAIDTTIAAPSGFTKCVGVLAVTASGTGSGYYVLRGFDLNQVSGTNNVTVRSYWRALGTTSKDNITITAQVAYANI